MSFLPNYQLLYETKYAIFGGRLCSLSIGSMQMSESVAKVRVTSSSDASIFLHGLISLEDHQKLVERLKTLLTSRSEDPSIIGVRVEVLASTEKWPFMLYVDPILGAATTSVSVPSSESIVLPLNPAPPEEFNLYIMKMFTKEKSQTQVLKAKNEELQKQLQAKNIEYETLKMKSEYQENENNLLRQLVTTNFKSRNNSTPIKKQRHCKCEEDGMSCGSDCETEDRRDGVEEDDEMDEDEFEQPTEHPNIRFIRSPSGRVTIQNSKLESNSETNSGQQSTSSQVFPNLNLKIEKSLESSTGQLSNSETDSNIKQEVVVGVVKYVICQLCPEEEQKSTDISTVEEMEAHLMDKHVDKEKKQCEACPTDEFQPHNIIQHMKIHTNSVYACNHCGKRGRKNYLRSHIRTHTGERPYRCDTCTKSFADASTLRRHRLVHTGEKKFQCPVCGRAIARKDNVKVHIRSHGIIL